MTDLPLFPVTPAAEPSSSTLGIRFDRQRAEIHGVLLCQNGSPRRFAPEVCATHRRRVPVDCLHRLRSTTADPTSAADRTRLADEFTGQALEVAQELLSTARSLNLDVHACGLAGFGLWDTHSPERTYQELIQTAVVAETTGITVLDDFPARDLAQGGPGGPAEAFGYWLLLADRSPVPGRRWRAVLDLGLNGTQCVWVPPFDRQARREPLGSTDIGPGLQLLEKLAGDGQDSLAALLRQGKVLPELVALWQSLAHALPAWHPDGTSASPLLYVLKQSPHRQAAAADLVASGGRFLAERVARFLSYGLDSTCPVGELLLAGEGAQLAPLRAWISEQLPGVELRTTKPEHAPGALAAAGIAALTLLHLWQVPCGDPNSGRIPRVWGRITPGSPANWQAVLHQMSSHAPWLLPLREAV